MNSSLIEPIVAFNCSLSTDSNFCNGGGCVASTGLCDCSFTFVRSGDRCQLNPYESTGAAIYAYRYGFAVLFSIVALIGSYRLAYLLKAGSSRSLRLVQLLFGTVTFLGWERAMWLWIDPHNAERVFPINLEAILFGLAIWLVAFIFFVIVQIWLQIMSSVDKDSRCIPISRIFIWVISAILLAFQIIQDGIRPSLGSGNAGFLINLIYWIFIGITCIVAALFSLVWGCIVQRRIKRYSSATDTKTSKKQRYLQRIWNITLGTLILTLFLVVVLVGGFIILFLPGATPGRFYVLQTIFRCFELAYPTLVLYNFSTLNKRTSDSTANSSKRGNSTISDDDASRTTTSRV